jgi:phosphoenolpyruvate carboxylase
MASLNTIEVPKKDLPLRDDIRLLGRILGDTVREQQGEAVFDVVERIRQTSIRFHRSEDDAARRELETTLNSLSRGQAIHVIRAFSFFSHLANIAEDQHHIRRTRAHALAGSAPRQGTMAHALERAKQAGISRSRLDAFLAAAQVGPVLTAHPTEVRRKSTIDREMEVAELLAERDRVALTPEEAALSEEALRRAVLTLWQTNLLRGTRLGVLDEVANGLSYYDYTFLRELPRFYAALEDLLAATDPTWTGTELASFLRMGSWIGGDRDGNPGVTAEITARTLRIHADHVLRGYEAVATRLMQTIAAATPADRVTRPLASRLARDAEDLPETDRQLRRRFPDEPYRQRFGYIAERLRRTRAALVGEPAPLTGRYASAAELDGELAEPQDALVVDGLGRVAWGEVAELRWQVGTFGFHLASLEIRQHAAVHAAALAAIRAGAPATTEVSPGVTLDEVLGTFRAIAAAQARFGVDACHHYVVSFTAGPSDVTDTLELARLAMTERHGGDPDADHGDAPILDLVPLFESSDALTDAGTILGALLDDPGYRSRLVARGDRQEVMLGYSDSNKESGFLAAAWLLHQAQASLARAARERGVELTLFHGRGGALGRGGGPTNRAILGQAPGSVDARLRLTEQGEVIAANYANPTIARRHLEQMTGAVLLASTAEHDAQLERALTVGTPIMAELAATARRVYRSLVHDDPGFASFFRDITPIRELSDLRLGSRPAARGRRDEAPTIDSLRAIPWTFAWSQARINLPGWYGLGTALEAYGSAHGEAGLDAIARLARDWPFLSSLLDNAEMSLAKADIGVARLYAGLATGEGDDRRWDAIETEFRRTTALVARVTGRQRLLDGAPVLQRSIALRNPYVDSLSELQVRLLARLRRLAPDDPERERVLRLVQLTVNGVAAGLQNTG